MIDSLKPYPAMKDSGVPWLGAVPEHWEVRRLKQAFRRIVGGSTPSSAEASFWDGDVVWVTPADVSKAERLRNSLRRITRDGLKSCSSELVPAGSIVVTSRAPVGNVSLAETELCMNQGCKALVITDEVVNPVFGFHVLKTLNGELQSLATGTTFTEISTGRLGTVAMPLPPLTEQAAIVRFLDHADRRIRRYIRAQQKLIKLLEEQKQAIIHRAVTRGLDPNVRLKPSGVEWLGDVPEHWEVRRLRNAAEMRVSNVDKHTKEGELPVRLCNYVDVYKNERITDHVSFMGATATSDEIARFRLEHDDVLITKDSESWNDIGVPALVEHSAPDLVCGYHLALLRPFRKLMDGSYLLRAMQSPGVSYQFHVEANGVTRYGLSHAAIKSISLPLPPLTEQEAIAAFLDEALADVERASGIAQREISLLREYRTRLIADVVTGKLDVREAAARLPHEAEEPEPLDEADAPTDGDEDAADDVDAVPEEAEA